MTRDRALMEADHTKRWPSAIRGRLGDPAVLTIIAVVFFISAVGQTVVQGYLLDDSVVTAAVLSVLGSVFLAAAIVTAARHHDQTSDGQPPRRRIER